MRSLWRVASITGHLLLVVGAVVAALVATSQLTYAPLRSAMVTLVVVLAVVSLYGRFPLGLGPVGPSVAARLVRAVGTGLTGIGAAGVVLNFAQGSSATERASTAVPIYTCLLAVYLAAFLAATRRGSELTPRELLTSAGLGLLAAALFAGAVPVLPPGLVALAFLLIGAAAVGAGWLARSPVSRILAGLLAAVTSSQALFYTAAVLYRYGPDAWMPYAGPGPLTPQAQLEQNRVEAIDPYVGQLFLGALAAGVLVVTVLTARLRARTEPAPAPLPVP